MGGYVTMVVAIFLIVFAVTSLQSQNSTCKGPLSDPRYCNENSTPKQIPATATLTGNFTSTIAACKNIPDSEAKFLNFNPVYIIPHGGSTKDEVKKEERTVPYIQRRINAPVSQEFFTGGAKFKHSQSDDNTEIDGKKYEVFYPMKSGEFQAMDGLYESKSRCEDPNDHSHCEKQHQIYFVDYQLVFLRHLNSDGSPVIVPGTENAPVPYNIMDIYQNTETIDDPKVGPLPDEAFDCSKIGQTAVPTTTTQSAVSPTSKTQVYIPRQQTSTNSSQLQLEWFLFGQSTGGEEPIPQSVPQLAFAIGCKPAVYLYPPQKELVNVKVAPKGFLTYTDPLYDLKNGWTVQANPDGKISNFKFPISNFKEYDYLYYESKIYDQFVKKPEKGWVVESGQWSVVSGQGKAEWFGPMEAKFNELLPKLGLNPQQTKDFIAYWKKALPYSPYYFIGVMDQDNVNQFEPLEITPKPDSVNRVRIYFEKLAQPKTVEQPSLDIGNLKLEIGNSFKVVEWGGMVKNDLNHPFTCSQ